MIDLPPLVFMEKPMKKIWITLPNHTQHVAGPRHDLATESVGAFLRTIGTEDIEIVPPGTPFEVDEPSGRYLVGRFGGRIPPAF